MTSNLDNLTVSKAASLIRGGELSREEIVRHCLQNAEKKNGDVNAYLEIFSEEAIQMAKKQDKEALKDDETKSLSGIPFAIKDVMLIKGKVASAGSKILENYRAAYEATAVARLREAGAIFIGRTNMDEFAMGSSTENSAYGPTRNPLDLNKVPGGSSGGSAAAVAMDSALAALGSDTGGSVRQPASFCGVVGLKPTYGAVSRYGLIAMASSFDQIGPLAKTVHDAEIIFSVIKGRDQFDSTSIDYQLDKSKSGKKLNVGVLRYDKAGVSEEVQKAFDDSAQVIKSLGHSTSEVDLPYLQYSLPCYYIIMPAEASTNLARFDGIRYGSSLRKDNLLESYMETRGRGFGMEPRRRIMLGTYVLSAGYYDAFYGKAEKVRELIKKDFKKAFESFDVIVSPTSPTTAFKLGEKAENPLEMYLSDIFTVSANIAGVPAISVPMKMPAGSMPAGIQLITSWFREDVLFYLGKQYENGSAT